MANIRPFKYTIKWGDYNGLIFCDIPQKSQPRVLDFLYDKILKHRIYNILGVFDEPDTEARFKRYIKHILESEASIMVLSPDCKTLIAAAGLLIMTKEWRSWANLKAITNSTGVFNHVLDIYRLLHLKAQIRKGTGAYNSLLLLTFGVIDEYAEDQDFLAHLFITFGEPARYLHLPRVTYIGMNATEQLISQSAGYLGLAHLIYSLYKIRNERPFDILRTHGELDAIIFEYEVMPIIPYKSMPGFEEIQKAYEAQELS